VSTKSVTKLKLLNDASKKSLEEIIAPFMSIETTIRSKNLVLTKKTLDIIQKAHSAVNHAIKEKIPLPKSTWMILRFGVGVQAIFQNLPAFAKYGAIKQRTRRRIKYVNVLVWDQRGLESTLKKTPKPKTKNKDDHKVFGDFYREIYEFQDLDHAVNVFDRFRPLFISPNSPQTIAIDKLEHLLGAYFDQIKSQENHRKIHQEVKQELEKLQKQLDSLKDHIKSIEEIFFSENTTGRLIKNKELERDNLLSREPLNSYIKFLGEAIDTFALYTEKQAINLSFDEQGILSALQESIISSSSVLDQNYVPFVEILMHHSDTAFGKKHWFKKMFQEQGSLDQIQNYLVSGPGFNAWNSGRVLNKDIQDLQNNTDYIDFRKALDELEAKKSESNKNITSFQDKERYQQQDLKEIEEKLKQLRTQISQWVVDARNLL
jgi:hypothetical protein